MCYYHELFWAPGLYCIYKINLNIINTFLLSHHIPLFGEGQSSWEWQHAAWLGTEGALLLAADNEVLARPAPPARRAPLLRLTKDASPGRIYNGVSDWLYQGYYKFIIIF